MSEKKNDFQNSSQNPSRREFVKTAAGAGLAAAALSPLGAIKAWSASIDEESYDYIIVGSGAGGGTLACRLVQKLPDARVLLIEAGGHPRKGALGRLFPILDPQQPIGHAYASENPGLAWGFYVNHYRKHGDPKKVSPYFDTDNRLAETNNPDPRNNGKVFYPRGSTLGGSTAVNAMITLRPDQDDWNEIADITGDDTWRASNTPNKYLMMDEIWRRLNARDGVLKNEAHEIEKEVLSWAKRTLPARKPTRLGWGKPWLHNETINPFLVLSDFAKNPKYGTLPRIIYAIAHAVYLDQGSNLSRKHKIEDFKKIGESLEALNEKSLNGKLTPEDYKNFEFQVTSFYKSIDPNTAEYVLNKTDGIINVPRATLGGMRFGTRDLIEQTQAQYGSDRLVVKTGTLVSKIAFNDKLEAVGVYCVEQSKIYGASIDGVAAVSKAPKFVKASKEVIVAGGAFNTPQLLMLSGIGPASEIEKFVTPLVDLPGVGKNLQDRYEVTVTTRFDEPIDAIKACQFGQPPGDGPGQDPCLKQWREDPASNLYGTNGVLAYITKTTSVPARSGRKKTPDLMIFAAGGKFEGYSYHYSHGAGKSNYVSWAVLKGHTENNAGEVTLKSKSFQDTPDINFHYFRDGNGDYKNDLAATAEGVEWIRDRLRRFPSKNDNPWWMLRGDGWVEELPGGNRAFGEQPPANPKDPGVGHGDRTQLNDFIERNAWGHHASCSCKMGPASDPMAVVDSKFRVHKVKNLRIVDASVFPRIPGLFIAVPTYMLGEKAAEAIAGEESKTYA